MAEDDRASNGWSDLPWDLVDRILQHLELPESLAVAAVCAPWRSAAVASGVPPRSRTPWLVSRVLGEARGSSTFRNLLDAGKTHYKVSLPQGRRHLAWCGASRGWLVASDELSTLLLCNPFTLAVIPLSPTTALGCVKETDIIQCDYRGCWFYLKVVLSCDPSHRNDYIAMAIYGNNQVAFARAGESTWRLVSEMPWQNKNRTSSEKGMDLYADCVSHNGRFYAVTMCGVVEAWDLNTQGPAQEPSRQAIIAAGDGRYWWVLTRFLVSTPWGALLQIRTQWRRDHRGKIKVVVLQVDVEERRLVRLSPATAFQDQAVFVGLNDSRCLHPREFPELRPNCIYFTTPSLTNAECFGLDDWSGVVIYDLESQTSDHVLPKPDHYSKLCPWHVWLIPNI